jgi:uncharacterized cofD-like protein
MKKNNIVTISGGTGGFVLLSGLKKYPVNISAILSMADDGGSTGRLRDELGVLPPGDVRQCLVALSDSSEMLRELMNYRFEKGGLKGHNFGNLLLTALEKINGDFSKGVREAAEILNVKGEVLPVTNENMRMFVELKNGKVIKGENELDHNREIQKMGIKKIYLRPQVKANRDALEKISKADLIVIGPGDLYGSILPNLLVKGIKEAICKSKAKVVFNCNLTNKKGQTEGYDLDDYVSQISKHLGCNRINFVTFNIQPYPAKLVKKYEKREGKNMIVKLEEKKNKNRTYKVTKGKLLNDRGVKRQKGDPIPHTRSFIRHDSDKLAEIIMSILNIKK